MSNVRLLLKAKREDVRVTHPFAAYSSSGQLRCTLCAVPVKHSSAWQGHLGTKLHRASIARLKEEEIANQNKQRVEGEKRRAEVDSQESDPESAGHKRRKLQDEDVTMTHSKGEVEPHPPPSSLSHGKESTSVTPKETALADLDLEWEMFQKHVVHALDQQEFYDQASLVVEPQLISHATDGLPVDQEQANALIAPAGVKPINEQDERELIMDRLLEEEKAQEEADAKVSLLRRKVVAFKQERRLARANRMLVVDG